MKRLTVITAILLALAVAGIAPVAFAQPAGTPGASETKPGGDTSGTQPAPPSSPADRPQGAAPDSSKPDVKIENRTEIKPGQPASRDDGSALPRSAADGRTTIFGLTPTAAIVIAAALLVVVILAIVAMANKTERVDRHF